MWLFDSTGFVTRDRCGGWGELLPILNQTANLLITLAYILIPCTLVFMYFKLRRREKFPELDITLWFGSFIILCGLTHLCHYSAFHWPAYRLFTVIDCLTAIASLGTAAKMPQFIDSFLRLPSHTELQEALDKSVEEATKSKDLMEQLKAKDEKRSLEVAELERQLHVIQNGGGSAVEALSDLLVEITRIKGSLK